MTNATKIVLTSLTALIAFLAPSARAQGKPDLDYHYEIASPAFDNAKGPVVCFDSGHHNYHTADDAYQPFARLLTQDGFRTRILKAAFDEKTLRPCSALVIATPVNAANVNGWAYPHPSAFETAEIRALHRWTRAGAGLLLIVDHSPVPGATSALMTTLGVAMFDGEARNEAAKALPDVFSKADDTMTDHPITLGREKGEGVSRFATWTGTAFRASREWQPILVYGPKSRMWSELSDTFSDLPASANPVFEIDGWLAAATRAMGNGRVAVLAEAAACSATTTPHGKRGMDTEAGAENAPFCLNTVRWLTKVIDPSD